MCGASHVRCVRSAQVSAEQTDNRLHTAPLSSGQPALTQTAISSMPTLQDHSTQNTDGKLFARDLVHDLIPKLKITENLVNNTLLVRAEKAGNDDERGHYQLLRQEFELEIMMIKMNLEHLLKRYAREIQDVTESDGNLTGPVLELDQHERFAIDSARKLYERARAIQTA